MARLRTAILISGRGSNMAALIDSCRGPAAPAEVVLVLADNREASGLALAAAAGVATRVVARDRHPDRPSFEAAIDAALAEVAVELVCLAGFMRVLGADFVERWRDRLINIHPSLLPAFRGLDTHARALAAGVRIHGCTVHFVRPALDAGPIIAQAAVAVRPDDTPDTLAARVLAAEHRLYPLVLASIAAGRVRVVGDRVVIDGAPAPEAILLSPPLRDDD